MIIKKFGIGNFREGTPYPNKPKTVLGQTKTKIYGFCNFDHLLWVLISSKMIKNDKTERKGE